MKKKFVISIVAVILACTMAVSLVACKPKLEEFVAPSKDAALSEVINAWMRQNTYDGGDALGLDADINLKDAQDSSLMDMSVKLQVALSDGNPNEALRLELIDNIAKSAFALTARREAMYITMPEKSLKFAELGLLNIGVSEELNDSISSLASMALTLLCPGKVMVKPAENGDYFDVQYKFTLEFASIAELLEVLVAEMDLPDAITSIIDGLASTKIELTIQTTGNSQSKIEGAKKGEPKYSYSGGKFASMTAKVSGGANINISASGLKLLNTLPEIKAPSAAEEAYLLKHDVSGSFVLKNKTGASISRYDYNAFVDFGADNFLQLVADCATEGSVMPLFESLFTNQNGKIFFEVAHECEGNCSVQHMSKQSRPVMTVAYDPTNFGSDNVYIAVNLRGIVPANLAEVIGGKFAGLTAEKVTELMNKLPAEDLVFCVSPQAYMKYLAALEGSEAAAGLMSVADTTNQPISIDFAELKEMLLAADEIAEYRDMLEALLDTMFPQVATIEASAQHSFGKNIPSDFNGKEAFVTGRTFTYADGDTPVIIAPIDSEITFATNAAGVYEFDADIYAADGSVKELTVAELEKLIGAKIGGTYTNILGEVVCEQMQVLEIIGYDDSIAGATQKIGFVIGGSVGNNFVNFAEDVISELAAIFPEYEAQIEEIVNARLVVDVIYLDIKLAAVN